MHHIYSNLEALAGVVDRHVNYDYTQLPFKCLADAMDALEAEVEAERRFVYVVLATQPSEEHERMVQVAVCLSSNESANMHPKFRLTIEVFTQMVAIMTAAGQGLAISLGMTSSLVGFEKAEG